MYHESSGFGSVSEIGSGSGYSTRFHYDPYGYQSIRRLLASESSLPEPVADASPDTHAEHMHWLCGRGLPVLNSHQNTADYGPCVATLYDKLEVIGLPSREAPAFAGVPMGITVIKVDKYGQTIRSDSSSAVQVYSALNGDLINDGNISFLGSIYSGFKRGHAELFIGIKPTFSNWKGGSTTLLQQPFIYIEGGDSLNNSAGASMQTEVLQVHIAQGYQLACPIGSILTISNPNKSSSPGECSQCKPGFYSLGPLAGTDENDAKIFDPDALAPGCFECPPGLLPCFYFYALNKRNPRLLFPTTN